jgi:hypothetical protein
VRSRPFPTSIWCTLCTHRCLAVCLEAVAPGPSSLREGRGGGGEEQPDWTGVLDRPTHLNWRGLSSEIEQNKNVGGEEEKGLLGGEGGGRFLQQPASRPYNHELGRSIHAESMMSEKGYPKLSPAPSPQCQSTSAPHFRDTAVGVEEKWRKGMLASRPLTYRGVDRQQSNAPRMYPRTRRG